MATSLTWPSSLPAPLADGYSETPPDGTIRSSVDAGPPKVRRRFTAGISPITVRYRLTKEQVAVLDEFYRTTTRSGSLRFNWTHPRTGAAVEARFKEPPAFSGFDFEATASVSLEVLP